jgi:hypothetical protein
MRRLLPLLVLALAVGGCAYESAGTTTSTAVNPADSAPATGPAAITFEDQMVEGSVVVVESVTLPAAGFVVLQADAGGAPGEVIGVSELIGRGTVSGVVVPFYFPLTETSVVHATLHIDMDGDGQYLYQPVDAFIDLPATLADGEEATAAATVGILAPIAPATVTLAEQRTDGTSLSLAEVTLPAPGFVALHTSEDGVPGTIIGMTGLLPEGTSRDLTITLDPPLEGSQQVFAVAYVDRDANGVADLTSADSLDAVAEGPDGGPARALAEITVVPLGPTVLQVADQEGDGKQVAVASVTLPSAGFLELWSDQGGAPGSLIMVSDLLPKGTAANFKFTLDTPLTADTTLWVRVRIDFDGDGVPSAGDRAALTAADQPTQARLAYTFKESP